MEAAGRGAAKGWTYLGLMYENGELFQKNERTAVRFYRNGAAGGDLDAMFNLALCYQAGHGVEQDAAEAKKRQFSNRGVRAGQTGRQ